MTPEPTPPPAQPSTLTPADLATIKALIESIHPPHVDKMGQGDWTLFGGTIVFALLVIMVSKISPDDGQTFQVISNLASGFGAALFLRLRQMTGSPANGNGSK